ncbi:MAG: argininosuccinate synthase [Acidobacteria bacterium]|nr:argininosuccinate synthase [Acidobacteriota bacterium]MCZ6726280.1 argininosuccinate synthase [Acidobacteriota bacterium]
MKVVLAYSGGLDTSVILHWIREAYDAEVITYTGDVGQGQEELDKARRAAERNGAADIIVDDLRHAFVEQWVFPAVRANAAYEWYYLMGTALARPVLAQGLVEAARKLGADAIAHGATGKGNDQIRFELSAYALQPDIKIIAPWREWDFRGRRDLVEYAKRRGLDLGAADKPDYSMDANLMHVSYEGGVLEDPWAGPPPGMFRMTVDPEDAPDEAERVEIGFEAGNPATVNGEALGPVELLERLNEIAGRHGVGRVDVVENRFLGMKSRGVYETPGVTLLHHAHRAVESITLDREVHHLRDELTARYAEMVYNGWWFSPEREALQSFMDSVQERVWGEARLKLFKGSVMIEGRRSSSHTLYDEGVATFEADEVYDQADATGFIRLQSLRLRTLATKRISEGE